MQSLVNNISSKHKIDKKSSQCGLPDGWTRATFIIKQDYIEKLKSISYWERKTIKELVDEALEKYLSEKDFLELRK